ncbi:doublesex- and mab-3-related transcription factor 2-like [Palaemon carinicauda]|uniref:doublesex- and mab-3-related transcription factor 2-like n=1 Tax=Palaemon carinicauda TaxID=392227 RepID=UPI0035B66CB0
MSRRPMKKYHFFEGGRIRTLEERDYDEEYTGLTDNEPLREAPGYGDSASFDERYGEYQPPSGIYNQDLPMDYSAHRSPVDSDSHSPIDYQNQGYADYGATGYSEPGAMENQPSSSGFQDPQNPKPSGAASGQRKRVQTCRLCANHGKIVEKKGHKPFCKYQTPHDCRPCEITLRMRDASAAQQKMTRTQQPNIPMEPQKQLPSGPIEFPRMRELEAETRDIINPDLFADINEIVKARTHRS